MNEIYLRTISGQSFRVEGEMRLGRDPACQINLNDARISRIHATLTVKEGFLYIKDEGSSNGTYINGIRTNKPTLLQHGDQIQVGNTKLKVEYVAVQEPIQEPEPPLAETEVVSAYASMRPPEKGTAEPAIRAAGSPSSTAAPIFPTPALDESELKETLTNYPIELEKDEENQQIPFVQRLKPLLFKKEMLLPLVLLLIALVIVAGLIIFPQVFLSNNVELIPTDPSANKEVFVASQEGREIITTSGPHLKIPPQAIQENLIFEITPEKNTPSLPPPLKEVGKAFRIQTSKALSLEIPIEIALPLEEEALSPLSEIAAFRYEDQHWSFLGGTNINKQLRFYTDRLGVFQIGSLPQDPNYRAYVTILIINQGDAQATIRPWQWWLAPDNTIDEMIDINQLAAVTKKEPLGSRSNENSGSIAYLSLPFGVYSSWCVGWFNERIGSMQYRIIPHQISLTRYSCRWEDFLQRKCSLETIPLQINADQEGKEKSCRK